MKPVPHLWLILSYLGPVYYKTCSFEINIFYCHLLLLVLFSSAIYFLFISRNYYYYLTIYLLHCLLSKSYPGKNILRNKVAEIRSISRYSLIFQKYQHFNKQNPTHYSCVVSCFLFHRNQVFLWMKSQEKNLKSLRNVVVFNFFNTPTILGQKL